MDSRVRAIVRAARSGDDTAWDIIEQALARTIDYAKLAGYGSVWVVIQDIWEEDSHRYYFRSREDAERFAMVLIRESWPEVVGRRYRIPRTFQRAQDRFNNNSTGNSITVEEIQFE